MFTSKSKINRILDIFSTLPYSQFKTELNRTLDEIASEKHPRDEPLRRNLPYTYGLILDQPNWRHEPKAIHVIVAVVMAECVTSVLAAHNIKSHKMTPTLRQKAHAVTEPFFMRLFREQVGNDVFEEYKAAHPEEF